ncbi:MAG: hypothetical protein JNL28_11000 [Planctomycetes bacterium]|nr:hypothetical protein [Planctomycetota bacterium]
MSDPTAEAARSPGAATILGIAAALMACAGIATFLIVSRGGPVDGAARLETAFGVRGLGDRYKIVEARELPTGAHIVMLDDQQALDEPTRSTVVSDESEKVDWSRVPIPASRTAPRRIVFLFPTVANGQAATDAFFLKSEWKDIADLGPRGGKVVISAKKIPWRSYSADWVHERVFEPGLTFRDAVNVNLSQEKRPCVMTALWSRGEAASEESVKELLTALGADHND